MPTPVTTREQFQRARGKARLVLPHFGKYLWDLFFVQSDKVPTMASDERARVYCNPDFMQRESLDVLAFGVLHEMLHVKMDDCSLTRKLGWDPKLGNFAQDLRINQILQADGLRVPEWALMPEQFGFPRGLGAVEYYALLKKLQEKGDKRVPQPGDGEGEGEGQGQGQGQAKPKPGSDQRPGAGNCGSCSHGQAEPYELPANDPNAPGISEVERRIGSHSFAEDVRDGKASRSRGTGGGALDRWAAEHLAPPRIPWEQVLASVLRDERDRRLGSTEPTFARASRRQWPMWQQGSRVLLPSTYEPPVSAAWVADTSGSMGKDELALVLATIESLCRALDVPVRGFCVDGQVYELQEVEAGAGIRLTGGGGTDMRLGIAACAELQPPPSVCVVVTDGYTPWPSEPVPSMAVVAVIVGGGDGQGCPDFIRVVKADV